MAAALLRNLTTACNFVTKASHEIEKARGEGRNAMNTAREMQEVRNQGLTYFLPNRNEIRNYLGAGLTLNCAGLMLAYAGYPTGALLLHAAGPIAATGLVLRKTLKNMKEFGNRAAAAAQDARNLGSRVLGGLRQLGNSLARR